jgi:trigger factor
MEPPFGENLIGMKVGEIREASYQVPDSFTKHAGEMATVYITLKSVTTKIPPTNDELAIKMQANSYEELMVLMKNQADQEARNQEGKVIEEAIVDKLIEMHEFEVPEKWVNEEMDYLVKRFGIKVDEKDMQFKEFAHKMAERNVRRTFILDAIYDTEPSLRITKDEIEALIKEEAERANVSEREVKNRLKQKNVMDAVMGMMRQKKVMNFVFKQVQFVDEENVSSEPVEIPEN